MSAGGPASEQYRARSPAAGSPTCLRRSAGRAPRDTGARRRVPRSTPRPPWIWTARSTMRCAASVAKSLAFADSGVTRSRPLSFAQAARYTSSRAASSSVAMSASAACVSWNSAIADPNCRRDCARDDAIPSSARAGQSAGGGADAGAEEVQRPEREPHAVPFLAEPLRRRHAAAVEVAPRRSGAAPTSAAGARPRAPGVVAHRRRTR